MTRARSPRRRRGQAPGWVWMLFGLGLGLLIAIGAYLAGDRASPPAANRTEATAVRPPQATAEPLPRAASPPAPDTRFEFYDILPQFEVVVPEVESPARPDRAPVAVAEPGSYVLQAGSFRSHADADRLQASLALLGVESRIQRVTIDDDVFHRVRVGPLTDLNELNRIRRQLRDAQVDVLLMRVAE